MLFEEEELTIENFLKKVKELIFYLDDIRGYRLYKNIKRHPEFIKDNQEAEASFVVLQFLVIPRLSTAGIADLLKKNLYIGLNLEDIDLIERIKDKLLDLYLEDRDNCKMALRAILVSNNEGIVSEAILENGKKIRSVSDWIKDYVSTGETSTLTKAQYFLKSYVSKLAAEEKGILKKLFALYEFLSLSSSSPEGFEDDLLLRTEDGKIVTTNKGKVVILYDPASEINKEKKQISNSFVVEPQGENNSEIADLQKMAAQYSAGSLERRAIEEEIKKLESGVRKQE